MSSSGARPRALALVAHRVVNVPIGGRQREDGAQSIDAVTHWAVRKRIGIFQLPLPYYRLSPAATGPEMAEARRAYDSERLKYVFGQLDRYRDSGYEVKAAIVVSEDLADACEIEWWNLFAELARQQGVAAPPLLRIDLDAETFDAEIPDPDPRISLQREVCP